MSAEELDAAIVEARRELLDAQHAELREREKARALGTTDNTQTTGRRFLPAQTNIRHWR